jgi:hypothetical protein
VEKHFKMKGVTTGNKLSLLHGAVEKHFKMRGVAIK